MRWKGLIKLRKRTHKAKESRSRRIRNTFLHYNEHYCTPLLLASKINGDFLSCTFSTQGHSSAFTWGTCLRARRPTSRGRTSATSILRISIWSRWSSVRRWKILPSGIIMSSAFYMVQCLAFFFICSSSRILYGNKGKIIIGQMLSVGTK